MSTGAPLKTAKPMVGRVLGQKRQAMSRGDMPSTKLAPTRTRVTAGTGENQKATLDNPGPSQSPPPADGAAHSLAPNSSVPGAEHALLFQVLKLESHARQAATEVELGFLIANETMRVVRARQIFVCAVSQLSSAFQVTSVSSLSAVDRNAPLIQWIESMIARLRAAEGLGKACEFVVPAYSDAGDTTPRTYPFVNLMWVPLWSRNGDTTSGMLLSREAPWLDADRRLAERLAETFGHANALLRAPSPRPPLRKALLSRSWLAAGIVALCAIGMLPMSISALAPAEVVARNGEIVAMPVDAIVQEILVKPNEAVVPGQRLVKLIDTTVRNQLKLAEREVVVARARVQQANSLAFSDAKGRHDLGIAQAELELKLAELTYVRELAAQYAITAHAAGVAVFSDRKDLEGKPLRTGDRLMQIVTPGAIELEIDLPVADSIVLQKGAPLRVFLDSDPLHAIAGTVAQIDYRSRLSKTNVAVYRIVGLFDQLPSNIPRLGTRGTAQIYGPAGTLALYLFRRPLSALRQRLAL